MLEQCFGLRWQWTPLWLKKVGAHIHVSNSCEWGWRAYFVLVVGGKGMFSSRTNCSSEVVGLAKFVQRVINIYASKS
jgi:hypothetical protein